MKYHVKHLHLSLGLDDLHRMADYGIVEADTKEEACDIIANRKYPNDTQYREGFRAFLSADKV